MLLTEEFSNLTQRRQSEKDASVSIKDGNLWTLKKMEVSSTNVPLLFAFLLFLTPAFEMYTETEKKEIFTCISGY